MDIARWQPDTRRRLQEAAMELFAQHGYESTTAKQIAEHAGLTERTFFRHFGDKREALFGTETALTEAMTAAIAAAPPAAAPLELIDLALRAGSAQMQPRRAFLRRFTTLVDTHPALLERELIKQRTMSTTLATTFADRGLEPVDSQLAADLTIATLRIAFTQWLTRGERRALEDIAADVLARRPL
jgi:AcrR family transcriptional regulator